MNAALTLLGGIWSFFADPAAFLTGTAHWMTAYVFPPQLQTWFLGTLGSPGATWDPGVIYEDVFRAVQAPALFVTAVAGSGRVLRATLDHRLPANHVVLDTLPRLLVALALIGVPGTHTSLGYVVIAFATDASMALAHVLFSLLMQSSLLQGPGVVAGWLDQVIVTLLGNAGGSVLVALALIPLIVLVLYALVLMVMRTVMLGFCIATAPLCIATAVFDVHNRFAVWWLDLFIGALTTPIVLGVAIALSITVAFNLAPVQPPIGALLGVVVMCGGLWMAAKMVHSLTWRHFSHGGAVAGFTAGVTTMLSPLHKLATAGSLAEAFGANRSGDNRTINSMKRIGLAAQGVSHAAPGAGSGLSQMSGAALTRASQTNLLAAGGPPDIGAALGGSGRSAVTGAEGLFAQRAFNAFGRTQSRSIGLLTRDVPLGAMPAADRAKLAWERTPPRLQQEFAEEFLSHWLGGADEDEAPAGPPAPSPPSVVVAAT